MPDTPLKSAFPAEGGYLWGSIQANALDVKAMKQHSEPITKSRRTADATPAASVLSFLRDKYNMDASELEQTVIALGLRRHGDYFQCSSLYGRGASFD